MRRIAIALSLLALVVGLHACAADAPTKPPSGGGGGQTSALQIQLFTSDANPKAGTCTLVEAIVSLNGAVVPDGTGVSFTTDFGTFSQNGLPTVSVVTSSGAAVTALCGPGAGAARIKATATVAGKTGSANLTVVFQPDAGTLPFVSSCSPSLGATAGGETITLNGGRFFGTTATSRVQFTAGGITRDGIVTAITANTLTVQTPGFPELTSPSTPAAITLTLGTNLPTPVVLSLPTCFTFGTTQSTTPTITALLPSQGTKEGGTRVTIIGSGFSTSGVQVFFGPTEATVVSTSFNQVIALSPPSFGQGIQTVDVTVKNISSGTISAPVPFRYAPSVDITAADNLTQSALGPFTAVTIFGHGFQGPVAVDLAGIPAIIQSVSATEIVVIPTAPLLAGCTDIVGPITEVNINTGDGTTSPLTFHYVVPKLVITGVVPSNDGGGSVTTVTITGTGFPNSIADADVKFGAKTAFVQSVSPGVITVTVPPGSVVLNPTCINGNPAGTLQPAETVDVTVTNRATTCSATATQAFSYLRPCVVPTVAP